MPSRRLRPVGVSTADAGGRTGSRAPWERASASGTAVTAAGAQAPGLEDRPRVQRGEGVASSSGRARAGPGLAPSAPTAGSLLLLPGSPARALSRRLAPHVWCCSIFRVPPLPCRARWRCRLGAPGPGRWHGVKAGADQPGHAVVPGGLGEASHPWSCP